MMNEEPNDESSTPPESILWPATVTDEQLDSMGPVFHAMERNWAADCKRIQDDAIAAVANQERPALQAALLEAEDRERWQKAWADRRGPTITDRHREVHEATKILCASIKKELDSWGQDGIDPADAWKGS